MSEQPTPISSEGISPEKPQNTDDIFARLEKARAKKLEKAKENNLRLRALPKRQGPRRKGSWYSKGWATNDIDNLPPLPMDENGFLKEPRGFSAKGLATLKDPQRKVAWLQWYNWSGGSVMYACQQSGITKPILKEWLKNDKKFAAKINEIRTEISDRLMFKMAGAIGLVKMNSTGRLSEGAILAMARSLKNEPFSLSDMPEENEDKNSLTHNIPRQGWASEEVGQVGKQDPKPQL